MDWNCKNVAFSYSIFIIAIETKLIQKLMTGSWAIVATELIMLFCVSGENYGKNLELWAGKANEY